MSEYLGAECEKGGCDYQEKVNFKISSEGLLIWINKKGFPEMMGALANIVSIFYKKGYKKHG